MILARIGHELKRVTVQVEGKTVLEAYCADTFISRLFGLHGMTELGANDALIIRPCQAIQTLGMTKVLDVAFVDAAGTILQLQTVRPRRLAWCAGAHSVIEMAEGTARRVGLSVGQVLEEIDR